MNIKEAKQEITNTLRAYLSRDELGNYRIPPVRQRPVLLMGPPGIGKTQIMEQIAAETGVGLVSYTITHHTRQSAIGLPVIETADFGGGPVRVTEYTMSEILASVWRLMERTGLKEGILFLDEINCVSETLAPMMLQFLQCKTFGNQRLPEGWLIVAAGNPPEYNRSVREFDVVTLDRVKRINVTEDFDVWKEYALRKGLHGAVVSYLDLRRENFYRLETTQNGLQFATPRGWEDLSELIFAYERLGLTVDRRVTEQYIQHPRTAGDFADYLSLYYKYRESYRVDDVLRGTWPPLAERELAAAPFDERLAVLGLLLSRLHESARDVRRWDALADALYASLLTFRDRLETASPRTALEELAKARREALERDAAAGRLEQEAKKLRQRELRELEALGEELREAEAGDREGAMEPARRRMASVAAARQAAAETASLRFDSAFRFLEAALGQGQELVLLVTELTAGYDSSWFIERFGCDAYFRHNRELLFDDARQRITRELLRRREDGESGEEALEL